jgi:hypothetical protein
MKCARSDFGNYDEVVEAVMRVCPRIRKKMDSDDVDYEHRTLKVISKDLQMHNKLLDEMESYLFQQDSV